MHPPACLPTPSLVHALAQAVKGALDAQGFWSCDITAAANRKLCQKLKEDVEIEAVEGEEPDQEVTWEVEKILSSSKDRKTGERSYIVKWKDWESKHNTDEPEDHLLCCKLLPAFWRKKKNKKELERVTKLQEVALREKQDAEERRTRRRAQPLQAGLEAEPSGQQGRQAVAGTTSVSRPADAPPACRAVYNNAHARLQEASALVFDTETSGFGGCVLNLGWILADESGAELVTCDAAT